MGNNNQTNAFVQKLIIVGDFIVFNLILLLFARLHWRIETWEENQLEVFGLVGNLALVMSQLRFSPIIHQRLVGAGDVLQRVMGLTILQAIVGYLLLRVIDYDLDVGLLIWEINTVFFISLVIKRMVERWIIRLYREAGRNTRNVTLVGSDIELVNVYRKLVNDATLGYKVNGYYGDGNLTETIEALEKEEGIDLSAMKSLERKGSIGDMLDAMARHEDLQLGDEVYVCLSRRERDVIKKLSRYCDYKVVRFYYVPVSVESIGLNLKRELLDDIEIYTTYENPLQSMGNRLLKRTFDIVMSLFFLIPTAVIFPFIWLIIKIQSPGPIFFKQARTGIDGKTFYVLKFRSMHVNKDADKLQATKNDPRKYPFGNFMRKSNIDELPQFINILKGDMSFVGPRPHMLAHTEQYSALITKYMVRHFVKPGLTGWAQVTGFRGETKELWQMEGRVKRDIWYMEHWSIWLDIRIIWMTFKTIFIHDKNAY
jgi:putative colanic acid biosynthesis UDP-glucose lipid carrier transferase